MAAKRQRRHAAIRFLLVAGGLLLVAAGPAAQIYRCDDAGRAIYQNAPCADTAAARVVDTTNAAVGLAVVDELALAALRGRERAAEAERRAAVAAGRARADTIAAHASRAAQVRAQQDQAAALAAIANELRLARLDGIGTPRYVGWRQPPLR